MDMEGVESNVVSATKNAILQWNIESVRTDLVSALSRLLQEEFTTSSLATCLTYLIDSLLPSEVDAPAPVAPGSLAEFFQSLKQTLPSTSELEIPSKERTPFAELLCDLIWTVDADIEDRLVEIAAVIKAERAKDPDALPAKAEKGVQVVETSKNPTVEKARQTSERGRLQLAELVKALVSSKVVPTSLAIERLEPTLSAYAGLIHQSQFFSKKTTQQRTNLFYKQTKFNLLREESEGYSKLVTELLSHHALPASFAWSRIVSLIGFFDLDPHRVLDIILDVMEANIFAEWKWFLELLKVAGWAKYETTYTGKGKEREIPHDFIGESRFAGMPLDDILAATEEYVPLEGTQTEKKRADVCAQLLGFKFSSLASDATAPKKELYFTAAILIREGFVSLSDLYPHLVPTEDDMQQLHTKYLDTVTSQMRNVKSSNALANAAPLNDEPDPRDYHAHRDRGRPVPQVAAPVVQAAPVAPLKRDPPNHKLGLLKALLSVGALRHSLFILTRHPWMVGAWPNLADLLLRVLSHSMEPLYSKVSYTSRYPVQTVSNSRPLISSSAALPKVTFTSWAPEPNPTAEEQFVFFYDRWSEWIPLCHVSGDLRLFLEPFMRLVGVHVHRDIVFLTKLCRLGKALLSREDTDTEGKRFWELILRSYLLPGMSMLRTNSVFGGEVWSLLRLYDMTERWGIYGEWKKSYANSPEMRVKKAEAERDIRGLLKRLSKDNVRPMARDFAKLSNSNPCIVFAVVLSQIQSYDNLNKHVVEATRLLTNLGCDILTFALLEAVTDTDKDLMKDDGISVSLWLQSLSDFIGHLYYARLTTMDPAPILQYLANEFHQARSGQLRGLIVLRELVSKMSAVEPTANLSESQVSALAGGNTLRTEALSSTTLGSMTDKPSAFIKSSERLLLSLQTTKLTVPLLILIARQRQVCMFLTPEKECRIKNLANVYDQCQSILFQYLEFLTSALASDDYSSLMPSFSDLTNNFGIEPSIAFQILRPKLNHAIKASDAALREQARVEAAEENEARLKREAKAAATAAKGESPTAQQANGSTVNGAQSGDGTMDIDVPLAVGVLTRESEALPAIKVEHSGAANALLTVGAANEAAAAVSQSPLKSVWHPALQPLFETAKNSLPALAQQLLGPGFFVTFWQLSIYDLLPPMDRYQQEQTRIKDIINPLKEEMNKFDAEQKRRPKDIMDAKSQRDYETNKRKIQRYMVVIQQLQEELKLQITSNHTMRKRLAKEKDHWFSHLKGIVDERNPLVMCILQHCIIPRVLLTPMDAIFCARFIKLLHSLGTKYFPTLRLYDKILSEQNASIIFSCTENEARNYARFIHDILFDLHIWFGDETKYNSEALGKVLLPGFQKKFVATSQTIAMTDMLSHVEFKRVVMKFHTVLKSAFQKCLESMEYMHVRNAIIVMTILLPVFPLHPMSLSPVSKNRPAGPILEERLRSLIAVEKREDLKVLAQAYHSRLLARKSLWVGSTTLAPPPAPPPRRDGSANAPNVPQANGSATQPAKAEMNPPVRGKGPPEAPKAGPPLSTGVPTGPAAANAVRPPPTNATAGLPTGPAAGVDKKPAGTAGTVVDTKPVKDDIPKPPKRDSQPAGGAAPPTRPLAATVAQHTKGPLPVPPASATSVVPKNGDAKERPSGPASAAVKGKESTNRTAEPGEVKDILVPKDAVRPTGTSRAVSSLPGPAAQPFRNEPPSAPVKKAPEVDPSRTIRPQVDPNGRPLGSAMQPPLAPSSTLSAQELRAQTGTRDLPRRPDVDAKPGIVLRPSSPPRIAPTSPRTAAARRRSGSPDPRRGRNSRSGSVESMRGPRPRDRDDRAGAGYIRDARGPDRAPERRDVRDHREDHRNDPRDKYRTNGEFRDDPRRGDSRLHERAGTRERELERPPYPRDRDRDMDRERDDRDRNRERQPREREGDRERDKHARDPPRDDRRADSAAPPVGDPSFRPRDAPPRLRDDTARPRDDSARPRDEMARPRERDEDRRLMADQARKRPREDDDVKERDAKRREHRTRRERSPVSDKPQDPKPTDRDRGERDRRREPHGRRDEEHGPMPPVPPSPGIPPTAPRSMAAKTGPVQTRWDQNHDRQPDRQAPPHFNAPHLPPRPPPNPPTDSRGPPRDMQREIRDMPRDDRRQRRDTPPRNPVGRPPSLGDRIAPREMEDEPMAHPAQENKPSTPKKRTYSDRGSDHKDDNGETRDANGKRQKRIDRQGVKQREASRSLIGAALKDTHRQDTRETRGTGRRGEQ